MSRFLQQAPSTYSRILRPFHAGLDTKNISSRDPEGGSLAAPSSANFPLRYGSLA
jgi:hypothetical protein